MPDPARRHSIADAMQWFTFDRLLTTLAFLAIALAACLMPAQNDTWWHLRAGQSIWATRQVLLQDTFSFTAAGAFWPNHEWLSQVLFFGIYSIGGLPLLTLCCASAVMGAWAIAWRLAPASPRARFLLVAWVLGSATTAWTLRPQVISQLLVAVTVWLLVRRRLVWLPPLFLIWANLHGAVLTGLVLVAASVVAAVVERLVDRRRAPGIVDGGRIHAAPGLAASPLPRLALTLAACLLATLATPLGVHLWREIPAFFVRIRHVRVEEFTAPQLTAPLWIPFWTAAAVVAGLAVVRGWRIVGDAHARRRGDVTLCACAVALLVMAVTAVRNVGPFLVIAVPALAALIPASWREGTRLRIEHARMNGIAALASIVILAGVVAAAYARGSDRLRWTPLPKASLVALESCHGNVYNRFDEGGYLIWFTPDRRVFIDSRYLPYPDDFIEDHVRIERTGDTDAAFRQYDIHCAYVPARSLVGSRLQGSGWTTLYEDARWMVLADPQRKVARAF